MHEGQRAVGSRIPAATSVSAASAASARSSSARAAARGSSARSSTATARARRAAGAGSRPRRSWIQRRAVRAPTASTRAAVRASGLMPSALSASTSSRTRNGEPPVARWHAAVKVDRAPLEALLHHPAHGGRAEGRRLDDLGARVRGQRASRCASSPSASGRVATSSAIFSSSRRGSR